MTTSMTYGVMPSVEDFTSAFERECPSGTYSIALSRSDSRAVDDFRLGDGWWSESALYAACKEIVDASRDDADPISHGDTCDVTSADMAFGPCPVCGKDPEYRTGAAMNLVSGIMETLGFDWV